MSLGGGEHDLRHGGYRAVVTTVGAGLRLLTHDGVDLVLPYPAGTRRPSHRGALLAPWPNRIADGRYTFDGREHQLPLTEPERANALHGLVAWTRFQTDARSASQVTLSHQLVPQPGYPFEVALSMTYSLTDDGLDVTAMTRNIGSDRAPWGVALHPYLVAGDGRLDDWTLAMTADELLEVTPDRLLPVRRARVAGTSMDFSAARAIGDVQIDHAFTGLLPDGDGWAPARLIGAAGRGVECRWDPTRLPWVQLHTADLPDPQQTRRGLAVEPMTCPPDAFNSGVDLVTLGPGDEHAVSWRIAAVA